ncbi:MAG: phospholipase domain-containing protein [Collimonas sp.]|uniref:phospholipase domain-containing protein n=1 Tax=Collimonas sp. TaxID=1963772 RepID=UPI003267DA89
MHHAAEIRNARDRRITRLKDNAYGNAPRSLTVAGNCSVEDRWLLASSNQWYDLRASIDTHDNFLRRFAGHVETGKASMSDPALQHYPLPEE